MILATILLLLLAYLLLKFGLERTRKSSEVVKYVPAFVLFALLLVLTAAFALDERLRALEPAELEPVHTQAALDAALSAALAAQAGDEAAQILLVGRVAELTPGVSISTLPQTSFNMQLDDSSINILIDSHTQPLRWPTLRGRLALEGDQPIVVLGTLQYSVSISGLEDGLEGEYIAARSIFAGSYAEYVDFIPRFAIIPTMTIIVSLISALIMLAIPLVQWATLRRTESAPPDPERQSQPAG